MYTKKILTRKNFIFRNLAILRYNGRERVYKSETIMQEILIATHNKGKFQEIGEVLEELPLKLRSLSDLNIQDEAHENGKTFEDNAEIKARFFAEATHLPTIADDSGIIIEAIKDELGVETRRWGAGKDATDEEWIRFFLERMKHEKNKQAEFICSICLCIDSQVYHFNGETKGIILDEPQAEYQPGIPLSAVFKPEGFDKVYSAMTIDEKNQVSHRGKAVHGLKEFLGKIFSK